ncbi:hypothetical protein DQW50_09875 [Halorubrum sp. 48-1-W]|uniref:DUF4382 domain-containing protein n=1 Tax=Halorubrum sp. 48-1-W TaxID=2249761 RepID=UPI000DCC2411|nr:DUF4382 domain-containing protein [Halorubrum sp. 48-1-W]RAW45266.1 hypothetical protein DQW50_09875 [Halorubrum sp. 48-1-W]
MTDRSRTTGDDRTHDTPGDGVGRREFVALGAGASATMLAGCAGDGGSTSSDGSDGSDDGSDDADGSGGSETLTGTFRLLISDAPADIEDFDSLDVTLDEARLFESQDGEDEEDDSDDETADEEDDDDGEDDGEGDEGDEDDSDDDEADSDDDSDDDEDDSDDDDENGDSDRGFTVVELDGATVDLTQVIEEDAIAVFDGEIPAGSYEKVELSVTDVEGIVDGEQVDVKLPSEKLQITNGFEVTTDEPVSFVFDINVVKRGPNNGYILRPVISGSGVAGRDVEVNEIDDEDDGGKDGEDDDEDDDDGGDDDGGDDDEDDDDEDDDDGEDDDTEESGSEPADDEDGPETGGNETQNGTDD